MHEEEKLSTKEEKVRKTPKTRKKIINKPKKIHVKQKIAQKTKILHMLYTRGEFLVDLSGFEPLTSAMRMQRSTN